jgi:drug/metabolite transporter (DMT)-like permease
VFVKRRIPAQLLLVAACLFWAGNMVITRLMHVEIPPIAMAFWRWAIAAVILAPFVWRELLAKRLVLRRHWPVIAALAFMGVAAYNTLSYIGLQTTTATNAALFNSSMPVFIALLAWLCLREKLRRAQTLGVLVSLCGVIVIVARGDWTVLTRMHFTPGDLWFLSATVLWAAYTIVLRWRPMELSPLALMGALVLFGVPMLLPIYAWELSSGASFDINTRTVAALVYYGTLPSIAAYQCWNSGVVALGASRAGLYVHLIPVFAALLSVTVLGESLYAFHLPGIALIAIGLFLTGALGGNARRAALVAAQK